MGSRAGEVAVASLPATGNKARIALPPRPRPGTASQMQARCRRGASVLPGCCYRIRFVFPSYSLRVLFVFSSYFQPFYPSARFCRWPPDQVQRIGIRALVKCICTRSSQPSTTGHVRMNTRELGGGLPNFLMYRRVMSLQLLTGAGSNPIKR